MDNLPPKPQLEVDDKIVKTFEDWTQRELLTALAYLYRVCEVKIDDIPHRIALALKRES